MTRGRLRAGTSGYDYPHWRGVLYPPGLARRRWFGRYVELFDAVELNSTFYGLPPPASFERWKQQAPEGFRCALKLGRHHTHMKKLKAPGESLRRFVQRARRLSPHLGPILVQLPPFWKADPQRLDGFLGAVPRGLQWAVELRNRDWLRDEVFEVLRQHGAALCLHDLLPDHPRELTTSWTYLRFHGTGPGYRGSYSPQKLTASARWIEQQRQRGVDVWAFFNNDAEGAAVRNARALRAYAENCAQS